MRWYVFLILTGGVFLAVMAFGIIKKQTYSNLASEADYLTQLQVAEFPGKLAANECANMEEELPNAPIILRVEVTGEIEHFFKADRQKAVVREVYVGSGLEEGDEIYLLSRHWKLVIDENPNSIERGFVNIMETGEEYLVFADEAIEAPGMQLLSVRLCDEFLIAPVFCYKEHVNKIMPITGSTTYVSYADVMDNEFYVTSEEALRMLEELKRKMLRLYPAVSG